MRKADFRQLLTFGICAFSTCLAGCERSAPVSGEHHGRYVGIGVFEAADLWAKMTPAENVADTARATLADDQHIIVIEDSVTGEVRECGDFSGFCVSMNPWTKAIARERQAPVALSEHDAELRAEKDAKASEPAPGQAPSRP